MKRDMCLLCSWEFDRSLAVRLQLAARSVESMESLVKGFSLADSMCSDEGLWKRAPGVNLTRS